MVDSFELARSRTKCNIIEGIMLHLVFERAPAFGAIIRA